MSRRIKPENLALQDRIAAVLADAWPEMLTSAQVAERVGGARTIWEVCGKFNPALAGWRAEYPDVAHCRADSVDRRFPATHHPGPVPQDSWEVPWSAMDVNVPLNRLARDGLVHKIKVQALRAVLWQWAGDSEDGEPREVGVADLEAMWEAS